MQIILKELQESAAAVETAGPPVNSPKAATVPATFAKTGDKHDVVRTELQMETFATGICNPIACLIKGIFLQCP